MRAHYRTNLSYNVAFTVSDRSIRKEPSVNQESGAKTVNRCDKIAFHLDIVDHYMHVAEVEGIGVGIGDDGLHTHVVILRARDLRIPIFITQDQAQAMQLAIDNETFERPLTHDLLVEMITDFGGAIDKVRIDELTGDVFFAKIDIDRYTDSEREPFVFDARPSDAIALALRVDCPIEMSDEVIDLAGVSPEEFSLDPDDSAL